MRIERLVEMAGRRYELDDMQKAMARNVIEAQRIQRRNEMGSDGIEYEGLQAEMFKLWNQPAPDGAAPERRRDRWRMVRNDQRFQEIRKRMREIEQKYLFDWEATLQQVEALLPPEQAAKGRARREQRAAAREEQRARRRQAAEAAPQKTGGPTTRPSPARVAQAMSDSERLARDAAKAEAARALQPVHPWEKLVKAFIADHKLSDAQANAALAILKDVRTRAEQMATANADRLAAAQRIPDRAERDKQIAEINQPVDQLVDELKQRLESLLTAEQRAKGI
jgi:hypothetical protein